MNSSIDTEKNTSNTKKILLWISLAVIAAIGIGILIWQLKKGGDGSKKGGDGSPQNWVPEQAIQAKSQMGNALPINVTNIVVKEYSKTHSFNDFLKEKDFQIVMPRLFSNALGKKNNWDSALKRSLEKCLNNRSTDKLCGKCVIKASEKEYSPLDFLRLSERLTRFECANPGIDWSNPPSNIPPDLLQFWKYMKSQSISCNCTSIYT